MTCAHSHTAQSVIFRARQRSAREHSFSSVLVFYATFALGPYSPVVRFGCKCSLVHFPRFDFLPMESGTVTAEQCETWGFLRAKTRRGRAQFFLKELTLGVSVWWQWCSFLLVSTRRVTKSKQNCVTVWTFSIKCDSSAIKIEPPHDFVFFTDFIDIILCIEHPLQMSFLNNLVR